DTGEHIDQGALAGAVGPDQARDAAVLGGKGNVDQRTHGAKRLGHSLEFKQCSHGLLAATARICDLPRTDCHALWAIAHRPRGSVMTMATTEKPRIITSQPPAAPK